MNKKCSSCRLVNFSGVSTCTRCGAGLAVQLSPRNAVTKGTSAFLTRTLVLVAVCIAVLLGFYLSLIASAKSLTIDEKSTVRKAMGILREREFTEEAFLLEHFTTFRSDDNWLNASVAKENAYAATNFPFEIITLYPDFFTYPIDDTERAAILLHEARHLRGKNEEDAYRFVWEHRKQLGWTQERYSHSPVWTSIRRQTIENVPDLFLCDSNALGDCDE